jgi:hypothetical protein
MADSDSQLEILIKLVADVTGGELTEAQIDKLKGALKGAGDSGTQSLSTVRREFREIGIVSHDVEAAIGGAMNPRQLLGFARELGHLNNKFGAFLSTITAPQALGIGVGLAIAGEAWTKYKEHAKAQLDEVNKAIEDQAKRVAEFTDSFRRMRGKTTKGELLTDAEVAEQTRVPKEKVTETSQLLAMALKHAIEQVEAAGIDVPTEARGSSKALGDLVNLTQQSRAGRGLPPVEVGADLPGQLEMIKDLEDRAEQARQHLKSLTPRVTQDQLEANILDPLEAAREAAKSQTANRISEEKQRRGAEKLAEAEQYAAAPEKDRPALKLASEAADKASAEKIRSLETEGKEAEAKLLYSAIAQMRAEFPEAFKTLKKFNDEAAKLENEMHAEGNTQRGQADADAAREKIAAADAAAKDAKDAARAELEAKKTEQTGRVNAADAAVRAARGKFELDLKTDNLSDAGGALAAAQSAIGQKLKEQIALAALEGKDAGAIQDLAQHASDEIQNLLTALAEKKLHEVKTEMELGRGGGRGARGKTQTSLKEIPAAPSADELLKQAGYPTPKPLDVSQVSGGLADYFSANLAQHQQTDAELAALAGQITAATQRLSNLEGRVKAQAA